MMAEGRKDRSVERAIWLLLSLFFSYGTGHYYFHPFSTQMKCKVWFISKAFGTSIVISQKCVKVFLDFRISMPTC